MCATAWRDGQTKQSNDLAWNTEAAVAQRLGVPKAGPARPCSAGHRGGTGDRPRHRRGVLRPRAPRHRHRRRRGEARRHREREAPQARRAFDRSGRSPRQGASPPNSARSTCSSTAPATCTTAACSTAPSRTGTSPSISTSSRCIGRSRPSCPACWRRRRARSSTFPPRYRRSAAFPTAMPMARPRPP